MIVDFNFTDWPRKIEKMRLVRSTRIIGTGCTVVPKSKSNGKRLAPYDHMAKVIFFPISLACMTDLSIQVTSDSVRQGRDKERKFGWVGYIWIKKIILLMHHNESFFFFFSSGSACSGRTSFHGSALLLDEVWDSTCKRCHDEVRNMFSKDIQA